MADDDVPEVTPDVPADADEGDDGDDVGNPSTSEEPVEEAGNAKESLTPNRSAKQAGIVVGTVLACAVIVVAAVWAIVAIVDEDDERHEDWFEYASPSVIDDEHRDWREKGDFVKPDFWNRDDGCKMPFRFGASNGPVVVLVVPGVGLGDWGTGGDFGFGGPAGAPRGLLPYMVPFFESASSSVGGEWSSGQGFEGLFEGFDPEAFGEGFFADPADLMDFFDEPMLEDPEAHGDLSLEVTELDNEGTQVLEGAAPT